MKTTVSSRLKSARIEKGYTQADVADLLGVERGSYAKYETGANLPSVSNLVKLSEILSKSPNYLLGVGTDNIADEEAELLELYRAMSPGPLKDNVLITLRATVQQQSEKLEVVKKA